MERQRLLPPAELAQRRSLVVSGGAGGLGVFRIVGKLGAEGAAQGAAAAVILQRPGEVALFDLRVSQIAVA